MCTVIGFSIITISCSAPPVAVSQQYTIGLKSEYERRDKHTLVNERIQRYIPTCMCSVVYIQMTYIFNIKLSETKPSPPPPSHICGYFGEKLASKISKLKNLLSIVQIRW